MKTSTESVLKSPEQMTESAGADPARGATVVLDEVSIAFGDNIIVDRFSLRISAGEFVCLIGPSGCGKSTLATTIAGFVPPASGTVLVNGESVLSPAPDVGVVFQTTDVLFDWLTARQNVEYGPRMRGVGRVERRKIADKYLSLVGLKHAADKYPRQISGGMRQRVQLARVLATEPRLILMDEPFGALDAQTREVMQIELDRIWRATGCTVLFVTHDLNEALLLADRVVTMTAGPNAGLKSVQEIDLPRPRDVVSEESIHLLRSMHADISEEVHRVLRNQGLAEEEGQ